MPNHRGDLRGNARTTSHPAPLYLVEAEFFAPAVAELRGAGAGTVRHLRRLSQRAAVLEIRRDPGCQETVIAELGRDAGGVPPPRDHLVGFGLLQRRPGRRPALAAADGAKQRPLGI